MSERRAMASGDVLANRYELQDLVTERLGSVTWRANDSVLNRNVGIEMLPSTDPRANHFLEAARLSTSVTDPRFLRVLDLIEDDHGQHLVVREWARAFPLDQLLAQSPLPSPRAARVMTEVADAVAHAHERGVYHRRLTPHHVLLKQSGAVRIVGLGVASALAPAGHEDTRDDLRTYERLDVESLGKLLYACLVSRWPGAHIDQLRAAPTEHGRLLRPRQVRAGVSRELDAVCDRILGQPPAHHRPPLTTAEDVARALLLVGDESLRNDGPTTLTRVSSPDLLRLDPVVVPQGPPPGLAPPRRRPKAHEPAPPTTFERGKARARRAVKGDRRYVLAGVVVVLVLATVLAYLVSRTTGGDEDNGPGNASAPVETLQVAGVNDLDPQSDDAAENPGDVGRVIDGRPGTGWQTTTYFNRPDLGGLKNGVGVVLDLGGPRELSSLRIRLAGGPTDVSVYASSPGAVEPRSIKGLRRIAALDAAGPDASVNLQSGLFTRYVVVWLTSLPEVEPDRFRGEIREVTVQGRA
ncbi:MAG: protein kinase family protein [Aeromicrobium sp.]